MALKVIWLCIFVGLYAACCIHWGMQAARSIKTSDDFFIAGRNLPFWIFALAATAASFSGLTFLGQPGLIYRDGFQYAYTSLFAIAIPLTGVLFLKRQWMLGKRFGFVTPGEMLSAYFQSDTIRVLVILVALLFAVPFLGVQFGASGYLFNYLSDGLVPVELGMWALAAVVIAYVGAGGLRATAKVGALQWAMLTIGIIVTGVIALNLVGGWSALQTALGQLASTDLGKWGTPQSYGSSDHNAYFAIPGVIQYTPGLKTDAFAGQTPIGGLWTAIMILTYLIALMGIQASPTFSMWAFSSRSPAPFATQQVWLSSLIIGFVLIVFTMLQGVSAHFLGADSIANDAGFAVSRIFDGAGILQAADSIVPSYFKTAPLYMNQMAGVAPWLVGLLAVCALAAMQATGAAIMSTTGAMLSRDVYKRYVNRSASDKAQILFGRLAVAFIAIAALLIATWSQDTLVLLGGVSIAFGLQMVPSLLAVCWIPWFTRAGVTLGLIAGLMGVLLTDAVGGSIAAFLGAELPWGRWPLTIHSAVWGILCNLGVTIIVSALTQNRANSDHQMQFHSFLRGHASLGEEKRKLIPAAWIVVLLWFAFGIGPGATIGNDLFGAPDNPSTWLLGMPSIWIWQILWWAAGCTMIWFLAYKMEMSRLPKKDIEPLAGERGDTSGDDTAHST